MDLTEKTVSSKLVYKGNIIDVRQERVLLPNGKESQREIVAHSGASAVVALNEFNQFVLVRQYRKAVEEALWEIPAGKFDNDEKPLDCAKRELLEETGYRASQWRLLTSIYTTPGFSNEIIHIFLAKGLEVAGEAGGDEDEFIEVQSFEKNELQNLVLSNKLKDAKTLVGLSISLLLGED